MSVILDRDGGDLTRTHRLGLARFEAVVRREIVRRGKQKPCLRIVGLLFAALADPAAVITHRPGALERVALLLGDWFETHRRLVDTEAAALLSAASEGWHDQAGLVGRLGRWRPMRIGTWNLAGKWTPEHAQFIERADCDVWLLTEVSDRVDLADYQGHLTEGLMATRRSWAGVFGRRRLTPVKDPHASAELPGPLYPQPPVRLR
jgi:hypothetical protein